MLFFLKTPVTLRLVSVSKTNPKEISMRMLLIMWTLALSLFAAGCEESGNAIPKNNNDFKLLNFNLPNSLTGGQTQAAPIAALGIKAAAVGNGGPCHYHGQDIKDPFENGYQGTRFMVSLIASWACIVDFVVDVVQFIPHDGLIHESDNNKNASNYDPGEPTHYRIVEELSSSKLSLYLYYGYSRDLPPTLADTAQFYLSWVDEGSNQLRGKLVVDTFGIDTNANPEHPAKARMDFEFSVQNRKATMYVIFDEANAWAEGLVVELNKDLVANKFEKVYTARGLLALKQQFVPLPKITEVPLLRLATVSNALGKGASKAQLQQFGFPFITDEITGDSLGNYLMDISDTYYFKADIHHVRPWDWIHKTASNTVYRGGRNLQAQDLTDVINFLGISQDYFTSPKCELPGENCDELMNAVFDLGYAGKEANQEKDPNDWRGPALDAVNYLDSVYPNGMNWDGAFDQVFLP